MTWCHSQLRESPGTLEGLVLSLVGLELATSCQQLRHFMGQFTLFGQQSPSDVQMLIESIVTDLYKNQVLILKEASLLLEDDSELKVSPLGRAAMKGTQILDNLKSLFYLQNFASQPDHGACQEFAKGFEQSPRSSQPLDSAAFAVFDHFSRQS
jgi:hypothetical protein